MFSSAVSWRQLNSIRPATTSKCLYILIRPSTTVFSQPRHRFQPLHASSALPFPRKRDFFSTNPYLQLQKSSSESPKDEDLPPIISLSSKRKSSRFPTGKTSLRQVAVEAQRTRDRKASGTGLDITSETKTVTAYCVAEQFDLSITLDILRAKGYEPDPCNTGLFPQVVHIQVPLDSLRRTLSLSSHDLSVDEVGDILIFPSGTMVAWGLPENFTSYFAMKTLLPAAKNPHIGQLETENLEYLEDPTRENSGVKGDTIVLGTKAQTLSQQVIDSGSSSPDATTATESHHQRSQVDTVLAKIAFSSGLARSTKLAILETLLDDYFQATKSIPTVMARGSRLPFTRRFILMKTGQLLSIRAQLNLYSELTDSLPDLFWDSRHELGLEGYYEQVGKALDINIRIKLLNEKMDYASEIASVLRERLSERHGLVLEWTIIVLIAVEVVFELMRQWREREERLVNGTEKR
ncbi:MAG: hypothetical protein M1834_008749 [Cirrosporium novae-zelandiae]|nr:MAG: hypothetical protein M1834_008749 [Cirrosporium novae-zelandiae]